MELKPGYKQTEVGVIPEDWAVEPIGGAFDICNHLRLPISQKAREKMAGPYPYYGPTNIQGYINEYRVEGEYALIGEDGDHFLKWRDSTMTLLVRGKFNVNNHAHLIKGSKNLTTWFYYFYAHRDLTPYLTRQGAGRYKLTKRTLISIPCALPLLAEQRAIAAALSDVDALIASLNKLIAKKRDIKRAAMQQLLTGKRRLPGFRGEWSMKPLVGIAEVDPENLGSDTDLAYAFNYISLEQVDAGRLLGYSQQKFGTAPSRARRVLRFGDVLMSTVRPYLMAHLLYLDQVKSAVCSTGFAVLRSKPGCADPAFLFYQLFGNVVNKQIEKTLAGSNYPGINSGDVKIIEIPCPPGYEEQTAIAAVLSDMDAEITALEVRRDKTKLLKQGMMQELLTGRIRLL